MIKAIALISGGLDSTLAAKLMQGLGIELIALNTVSPFCLCNHRSSSGCFHGASVAAKELGLPLRSINVSGELLEIVKKPKHGYGSNMNPCIDCRILLFKKAKEAMQKEGASFVITGEVVGQRPMSQRRNTMRLIESESGLDGLVLRPLSARLLEPTIPEKEGWINREKLLAINGRGRRQQISLANEFGINDYPCPSGGCLLTDPEFSRRIKDLMKYQELNLGDIQLLKIGRHFRLSDTAKLIVGRNQKENEQLLGLAGEGDYIFGPNEETAGPNALGKGVFNKELIELVCAITCRYCDLNGQADTEIVYTIFPGKEVKSVKVTQGKKNKFESARI
jgi:tRNA U34 2-thiouridine synthase MnmA/TrmU